MSCISLLFVYQSDVVKHLVFNGFVYPSRTVERLGIDLAGPLSLDALKGVLSRSPNIDREGIGRVE